MKGTQPADTLFPGMRFFSGLICRQLFFLLFFTFLFFSCKKGEDRTCFKSLGKTVTESRPVSEFDFIYLHDNINLVITQDSFYSITVEAPGNLINFIRTDIEGNNLTIKNMNKCNFMRSYKYGITVYVSLARLENIYFTGAGKITSTNTIKTPILTINFWGASGSLDMEVIAEKSYCNMHTGPGDITLRGSALAGGVYSMGNGYIHLENYTINYAYVNNSGTGDFFINAQKAMFVAIHSLGSVYYTGNPSEIKTELDGEGQLIKL